MHHVPVKMCASPSQRWIGVQDRVLTFRPGFTAKILNQLPKSQSDIQLEILSRPKDAPAALGECAEGGLRAGSLKPPAPCRMQTWCSGTSTAWSRTAKPRSDTLSRTL